MDIQKLKTFLICCEEMNYTRAADRLFISRQALRQAIQALEIELNTVLFSNSHNRLALTEAGEIVRQNAQKLVGDYNAMLLEIHSAGGQPLRIGLSSSMLPFGTPELVCYLDEYDGNYPQFKLELSSCASDLAVKKVLSGELSAAILLMMSCDIPGITGDIIETLPVGLTFSQTHRFAQKTQIRIEDLAGEQCIVWGSPELFLKPLSDALAEAGIQLDTEIIPSAKTAFYRMEHDGRVMIEYGYPKTRRLQIESSRPIADRKFTWNMTLIRKTHGSSPALSLLKDYLTEKYIEFNHSVSSPGSPGDV